MVRFIPFTLLLMSFIGFSNLSHAQVVADFNANQTSGCSPLLVQFQDLSTSPNGIQSWAWTFGDATSTTLQNPAKLYNNAGNYTICLTVIDSMGLSDTKCLTNYIQVSASPSADFSATNTSGCNPVTVTFTDQSTLGSSGIMTWSWNFGDGAISSMQSPVHTYTTAGSFNVTLQIVDSAGCSHQITKPGVVTVNDYPVANFIADNTVFCTSPATVNFTNTSTVPSSANMSYTWDFGDNTTSTLVNPSHTYNNLGTYTVSLIANDLNSGCADTLIMTDLITVTNATTLTFDQTPTQGCGTVTTTFTNTTTCPTSNWQWDFGDGSPLVNVENPTHTYTTPGCYTVTFTADLAGSPQSVMGSTCIQVDSIPVASYTTPNVLESCDLPYTVSFSGSSTIAGSTYSWDFGDGNSSSVQNPTHTYTAGGTFPITLTVTTPQGCTHSITSDTMYSRPIVANFEADLGSICVGETIQFTDSSTSFYPITSYVWKIGDSVINSQNLTYNFPDSGSLDVKLIVTNNQGCVDSITTFGVGIGDTFNLDFMTLDTMVCIDDDVAFMNTTDPNITQYLSNWQWQFGDGQTSAQFSPVYAYQDTGTFTITLTAQHYNCESIKVINQYVNVAGPLAEFTADRDCASPLQVSFINETQGGQRYFWDFGVTSSTTDTSTQENPVFTYPSTGTYVVQLTAINDSTGCFHTYTESITLTPAEDVNLTLSTTSGCAPLDVIVYNSSSNATYAWTAPGAFISDSTAAQPIITYSNPGLYDTIKLEVTHPNGCQETIVITDTIDVTVSVSDITPAFQVDAVSGCAPLTVNFTDQSSSTVSPIVSWLWDFGDGNFDTIQHPSHTYTTAGTFDVFLTVSDTTGCTRTVKLNGSIIPTAPQATANIPDFGCTGQQRTFTSAASGIGLSYSWDFGDGTVVNSQNTTHTYTTEGTYTVCLSVSDINGCINLLCDSIVIGDPVADFTASNTQSVCQSLTVPFQDLSANAVAWQWDFGDGTGSVLQNPSHVYNDGGNYDVTLIITNGSGCTDTLTKFDFIMVDGPGADYTFAPDSGCPGLTVNFNYTGYNVSKYTWVYGDFTTEEVMSGNLYDTLSISHTYNVGGVYFPTLIVEDTSGCVKTYISSDSIVIEDFAVTIHRDSSLFCDNGVLQYTNTISSPSPVTSLVWTHSMGTATTDTLNLTYNSPGTYAVSLTASNASCVRTVEDTLIIHESPQVNFDISPDTACSPQLIQFSDSTTVLNDSIVSWAWDFGTTATDTLQNPSYTYTTANTYTVQLTATSSAGCVGVGSQSVIINATPTAFAGNDVTICENTATQLQATGGATYQWQADSTLSCLNCPNPMATPTVTTDYIVTVISAAGCTDVDTVTVSVVPAPSAMITNGNITECDGAFITFQDGSTTPGGTITNWAWDFGDNTTSNFQSPSHVYNVPGVYTVTLVITASTGCLDTASVQVTINPSPTVIASGATFICQQDSAQLQATTIGGISYQWAPANTLTCSTCPDPIAFPSTTTTYVVTTTATNGCTASDTVEVTVSPFPNPVLTLSGDTTICSGDVVQLFAGGSISPLDFEWDQSRPGLSCYVHCNNPFASPTVTTTYVVTLTGPGGCTTTDSLTVTVVSPNQDIIVGGDQTVCIGESIGLNTTQGTNHAWTPFDGLSCVFCPNPIATPTATTEYIVTALNNMGCTIMDTVTITVLDPKNITAGEDVTICPGGIAQINASGTGIFSWAPDSTLSDLSILNPTATPTVTTDYYLTVDNGTCIITDTVTVFVLTKAEITTTDIIICEGDSVELPVIGLADAYTWTPSESLSDPTIERPIAFPTETTTYTVVADLQNCASDSATLTVTVQPAPQITGFPIQMGYQGQSAQLSLGVEVNPSFTYNWSPSTDLNCTDCPNPIAVFVEPMTYYVTVTNPAGCVVTDSIRTEFYSTCDENLIVVPNAFTPNGDGLNDVLYVRGSALTDISSFRIFSRNGELVFESNTMSKGWDGTYQGKPTNTEVFVYVVEAICPLTGNLVMKRGNVTLMR